MKYILGVVALLISTSAIAADPVEYLRAHLAEMQKHRTFMQKVETTEYMCTDLVEHAKQMTRHMEQMTEMMAKMHERPRGA